MIFYMNLFLCNHRQHLHPVLDLELVLILSQSPHLGGALEVVLSGQGSMAVLEQPALIFGGFDGF